MKILTISTIPRLHAQAPVQIINVYDFATNRTLGDYISPLLTTAIVGAGIISFILIVGAGFMMISSAGNPQAQEKGKSAITAGIMGLVLVVSAYWIIQIIELLTGTNILSSPL